MLNNVFSPENRAICEVMSKNIVQLDRAETTLWRTALHSGYLGYKHTLRICNTNCISIATMVAQKRLNVTLYEHYLSCSF